jgi:hypothetical protein
MSLYKYKKVTNTFLSGRLSCTLIIPIEIARKYRLNELSHVVIEEKDIVKIANVIQRNPHLFFHNLSKPQLTL